MIPSPSDFALQEQDILQAPCGHNLFHPSLAVASANNEKHEIRNALQQLCSTEDGFELVRASTPGFDTGSLVFVDQG